jgi:tetratricopeptide (TPR) repeat protein
MRIMRDGRRWLAALALALAAVGVMAEAARLAPDVVANAERVEALHVLAGSVQAGSVDEAAWDAGWRSLCSPDLAGAAAGSSQEAMAFVASSQIDRGDYAGALAEFRRIAAGDDAGAAELASAYVAALEMRWLDAARLYPGQPTPRHERFWATVFYLAAQELMFRGQTEEAAPWYRRADEGYGVLGPYLGLSLVDCLAGQGRTLEAFDALRRSLAVAPPDEALAQRQRFEQMRRDALQMWQAQDPDNALVAGWRAFFDNDRPVESQETLEGAPQPMMMLAEDLGDGRTLIGMDYRQEDIETGPFLWVDLYLRVSAPEGERITRQRHAVLNQAPNGAFTWDAAPDEVRPFGWHGFLYRWDPAALTQERGGANAARLCLSAGGPGSSIGSQSLLVPLSGSGQRRYVQSSRVWPVGDSQFSVGRRWSGTDEQNPHGYTKNGPGTAGSVSSAGIWTPPPDATGFVNWLIVHQAGKACFADNMVFRLP